MHSQNMGSSKSNLAFHKRTDVRKINFNTNDTSLEDVENGDFEENEETSNVSKEIDKSQTSRNLSSQEQSKTLDNKKHSEIIHIESLDDI